MKRILIAAAALAMAAPAAAAPPAPVPDTPFGAPALAGDDLAHVTGRADTAMAIQARNTSTVANNSVNGPSQTGTISFAQTAFQNLSGLSLLSANTGNNVSINSSLNLNVSIQP